MREQQSFLSAVMGELSRRKVLRTLGAYAVGVFVILQLMDAAVEPLRLPAPQPIAAPVFIHDCVTPLAGETLLSLLMKRMMRDDQP